MDHTSTKPVFLGGTVAEHLLFVLALCRFQHHTLPLALVHYVTWSVVGVALHVLALTLAGPLGPIILALALTAWAVRLDVRVGLLFGLMQIAYAWTTLAVLRALIPSSEAATGGLALVAIVAALTTEVASHHVLQGYGPRPPPRAVAGLSRLRRAAFVPYFVMTFGIFFLTLDLAMRVLAHRRHLHLRANAIAAAWHEDVVSAAIPAGRESRELRLHRRAITELS
jgi:hypothetical protein